VGGESRKLVVVHVSTPSSWRGGEQQLFYLMEALKKQRVEQHLICNIDGELYKKAKVYSARGWNVIGGTKRSGMDLGFASQIKRLCKNVHADLIHAHDSQAHTLVLLANILFGCKVPVVLSRRVDFPVGGSIFSKYKYNHPMVAKIICVSDAIKEVMKPAIKNHDLLQTVYSGIDLKKFKKVTHSSYLKDNFDVPEGYNMIGNVSAIAPHKDYYTFVDTAELLVQQGMKAKFFIVGDGPEKKAIVQYVKDKSLHNDIYFTGFVKEVLPILKSLDLMLVTSKTEGLGTTILDAFACGVPVVATRAGGIPEIVQHHKTGLTAEVGDSKGLSELVIEVLNNDDLQKTLLDNATNLLQDFTRENTAKKTLEVYEEAVT
jgi:glycosyltransferase involved in cell wall biosynthesis